MSYNDRLQRFQAQLAGKVDLAFLPYAARQDRKYAPNLKTCGWQYRTDPALRLHCRHRRDAVPSTPA